MSGNNGARASDGGSGRLPNDLGLHYTGIAEPYQVGAAGVDEAALFLEMVVAEVVAAVIWEKRDQPWEFTLDLARHEWDEMRHALMGQAALEAEGIDWADEVKHVHIGREWTTHLYDGDASRAKAAAEQAVEEFWQGVDQAALDTLGELPWYRNQPSTTAG